MSIIKIPAELKGRKSSGYPKEQMHARDQWFRQMREKGFTSKAIGQAAGVSATRVSIGSSRAGYLLKKPMPTDQYNKRKIGLNFGKVGPLVSRMSEEKQWKLAELAFKYDLTLAEALIEYFFESEERSCQ